MRFVNREAEMNILDEALSAPSPALFVLYGRRRVGKTALLRRVCRGFRHVFFTADLGSRSDQLSSFSACLARGLDEPAWAEAVLPGWEEALQLCCKQAKDQPLALVLDEFQHMVSADPSLASVLQRLWDSQMQSTRLSIVLCGSYVSFMEREVLGVRNPLYGRRTGQLLLRPLLYRQAGLFFPDWDAADRMTALAVLGGVPAYLQRFDPSKDLQSNIFQSILNLGAPLFDEPRFLMLEELREPQVYFSICRAIAHGNGRPNQIAQAAGLVGKGNLAPYLNALQEMHFVERRVPVTVRNPQRSRRSLYRLRDPYLRFWFRFVLPNKTALEAGDAALVWSRKIAPRLAQLTSTVFEEACQEHLMQLNRQGNLPAVYDRIGAWWRGPHEVDVVAVADDGPLLLGECKWTSRPVGVGVLHSLQDKARLVSSDLERPASEIRYVLFSRSGFTPKLKAEAVKKRVLAFQVGNLFGAPRSE